MARPKKQTVDYFPHYCSGSKSIFIIQNQYGNDGYAFWFKLLQILGKSEGHVFDYNNRESFLFLLSETHTLEDQAIQMLETLAIIGSIDKELWEKKIIWSQNFVDNVADVYTRRQAELPTRPGDSVPESATTINVNEEPDFSKGHIRIDDEISTPTYNDLKIAGMIKHYEEELGRTLTPNDLDKLKDFADTYADGWFEKAVEEAKNNNARAPVPYIEKIMETWIKEGVNPLDKRERKSTAHRGKSTSSERLRDSITKPNR